MRLALAAGLLAGLSVAAVAEPRASGTSFLSDELRAMQQDEAANPGMLWVGEGARLWAAAEGEAGISCASCHDRAEESMAGVAARYPVVRGGAVINLEAQINRCRTGAQKADALPYESDALLALTAFVARQSLGMPVSVKTDGDAAPLYAAGEAFFHRRQGQMNLSCAHCHDANAGRRLRGDAISHGLPNGYPAYRLEWQTLGSLHRRLRACSLGVRAVQFDYGSPEYLALELYLAKRAEGAPVETPAIRK
ncbi:MAG: sulfur oxidation c-type cytochrome SoxA [Hyphomicrobiales bacterium]|nr:sulfur oxidation c-type cytochrome SoxA [Hyphomicrobiales bacterium]